MDDINLTSYDLAPLCSLCGGSFGKASEIGQPPDQDDRHWSQIARGIRGHKSSSDAQVAPLTGKCVQSGRFLGPSLDETTDPFGQGPPRQYELTMRSIGETTYGVHDLCWQLLLRRVEAWGTPVVLPELVAQWLFQLFAALPCSLRGGLITQHGYFGALNERKQSINRLDIGIDYPAQGQPRKDLIEADPMPLPKNTLTRLDNSSDPFHLLPYEILCLIFPLLSSKDISHSRLASRSFAVHATPSLLPLSFWATRFSHDGELGFLGLNDMPKSSIDCCHLYRHYRRRLDTSPGDRGFQNRRRIWCCLEPFATTLAAILKHGMVYPIPVLIQVRSQEVVGHKASCYQASTIDGTLQFGAKTCRVQNLLLPNTSRGAILKVFTLPFESRTYVCGLQLVELGLEYETIQAVGLTFPTCTSTIHLDLNASIIRVDVQLSLDGIHGLFFYTMEPNGYVRKQFAGITTPQNCYTAVATLEPYGTLSGFVFEFDTFKALSIQLIENSAPNCPLVQPKLWDIRNPPPVTILRSPKLPAPGEGMFIHCYAPFGGKDGSRLSSLVRMTAFLDSAAGLYGMSFSYTDGSELLCGLNTTTHELGQSIPCIEQSFFINGPEGERITRLRYTTAASPHVGYRCIVMMEVFTQFNHHHVFRGFDNKGYDNLQQTAVNIPHNQTPNALIIELAAPLWCCSALYVGSSLPLPKPLKQVMEVTSNADITQQHTDNAPWMIRDRGSSLTSAPLSTLRRVRISVGKGGRSCSSEHISGLWFEYVKASNDTVVGQWLDEMVSFTLETDENLVGLTIHGRQSSKPAGLSAWQEFRAWRGIKVVGLDFQTSKGRRHQFSAKANQEDAERDVCLAYCATPYEEMDTIIWASNFRADDIQVSFKPGKSLGLGHLLLCEAASSIRHPCLSMQQTRHFFNYDNVEPEPMNPLKKTGIYGAMRRYYHASETFLWRERSPDNGELVSMTKIDLVYDTVTDGVRGIRFNYERGFKKEFGLMNGDVYTLQLTQHQDEKISLLVARRITDGHYGMELHTTTGQICRAIPHGKEDYEVDSYAMLPGAKPPKIIGETQWRKTHWSFPDSNPTDEGVSHSVGLWVSGEKMRMTNAKGTTTEVPFLDAFGPIYITDSDARSSRFRLGLNVKEKIHNATQGGGWTFR